LETRKWGRGDVFRHIGMIYDRQNKLCKKHGIKLVKENASMVYASKREYLKLIDVAGFSMIVIETSKGVKHTLYVRKNRIFEEDHLNERVWFRSTDKRS